MHIIAHMISLCVPFFFRFFRQRRRHYRGRPVDGRGHLEREEENLRRRHEHQARRKIEATAEMRPVDICVS